MIITAHALPEYGPFSSGRDGSRRVKPPPPRISLPRLLRRAIPDICQHFSTYSLLLSVLGDALPGQSAPARMPTAPRREHAGNYYHLFDRLVRF
jgi:hypothetical protein